MVVKLLFLPGGIERQLVMTSLATAISPDLISPTQPPNPRMDVKGGQTTTPGVSTQFAEQGMPLPIHDL